MWVGGGGAGRAARGIESGLGARQLPRAESRVEGETEASDLSYPGLRAGHLWGRPGSLLQSAQLHSAPPIALCRAVLGPRTHLGGGLLLRQVSRWAVALRGRSAVNVPSSRVGFYAEGSGHVGQVSSHVMLSDPSTRWGLSVAPLPVPLFPGSGLQNKLLSPSPQHAQHPTPGGSDEEGRLGAGGWGLGTLPESSCAVRRNDGSLCPCDGHVEASRLDLQGPSGARASLGVARVTHHRDGCSGAGGQGMAGWGALLTLSGLVLLLHPGPTSLACPPASTTGSHRTRQTGPLSFRSRWELACSCHSRWCWVFWAPGCAGR